MKFQQLDTALWFLEDPEVTEVVIQYEWEQDVQLISRYLTQDKGARTVNQKTYTLPYGKVRLVGVQNEARNRGLVGTHFLLERLSQNYAYGDTLSCFPEDKQEVPAHVPVTRTAEPSLLARIGKVVRSLGR